MHMGSPIPSLGVAGLKTLTPAGHANSVKLSYALSQVGFRALGCELFDT